MTAQCAVTRLPSKRGFRLQQLHRIFLTINVSKRGICFSLKANGTCLLKVNVLWSEPLNEMLIAQEEGEGQKPEEKENGQSVNPAEPVVAWSNMADPIDCRSAPTDKTEY